MSKKTEEDRPTPAVFNPPPQRTSEFPQGKPPENAISSGMRAAARNPSPQRSAEGSSQSERIKNLTTKALVGQLRAQGLSEDEAVEQALRMVPDDEEQKDESAQQRQKDEQRPARPGERKGTDEE